MILTLHGYLGRELLKTFLMTSVALTALVVMSGGVANIVRGEGIGAEEIVQVFAFLTPVAITLILPVAALFSATITYGRAAVDNEVIACRAAGVNIHRLLLAALLLGLLVTGYTYWSWNHLIPGLSQRIVQLTRLDLPRIVMGQFRRAKPLAFGKYRLTAGGCELLDPARAPEAAVPDHTYLMLSAVGFVELDGQEFARYGTADATVVDFDRSGPTPLVTVDLQGVRSYDASRRQYYEMKHQLLGPFEVPLPVKRKLKFEDLPTLLRYQRDPQAIPDVEGRVIAMRRGLLAFYAYSELVKNLDPEQGGKGLWRLERPDLEYEISCARYAVDPETARPTLATVTVREKPREREVTGRIITADSAVIGVRSTLNPDRPAISVELSGNVEIRRDPPAAGDRPIHKPSETLLPVEYMDQPSLGSRAEALDIQELLSESSGVQLPADQARIRDKLLVRVKELVSEVTGEIHFRASYAACTVAVVVLGALLGMILRGGQVLSAFGVSCIPTLFVVLTSIVGRNLAGRPEYTGWSLATMWGGAVVLYLATAFVALKLLKR